MRHAGPDEAGSFSHWEAPFIPRKDLSEPIEEDPSEDVNTFVRPRVYTDDYVLAAENDSRSCRINSPSTGARSVGRIEGESPTAFTRPRSPLQTRRHSYYPTSPRRGSEMGAASVDEDDASSMPSSPSMLQRQRACSAVPSITSGFDEVCTDMKRILGAWINQVWTALVMKEEELAASQRSLKEERRRIQKEFEEYKRQEHAKLKQAKEKIDSLVNNMTKQLTAEREAARARFEGDKTKFEHEKQLIIRGLRSSQLELENSRNQFDQERKKINDSCVAESDVIQFNVGGTVYQTSRSTLERQPDSLLARLVSGYYEHPNGTIFLDRDPELFRKILSFLRKPDWNPQMSDYIESEQLALEAEYYGINFNRNAIVCVIGGGRDPVRKAGGASNEQYATGEGASRTSIYLNDLETCDAARTVNNTGFNLLNSTEPFGGGTQTPLHGRTVPTWSHNYYAPMSTPRAAFVCGQILNSLYVAGGYNQHYRALCEVEAYDLFVQKWHTLLPMNEPRRDHCGAIHNNRILYCIGGFNGSNILSSGEFYDPRTSAWTHIRPMSSLRKRASCVAYGDNLYVFGGAIAADSFGVHSANDKAAFAEVYDIRANAWRTLHNPQSTVVQVLGSAAAIQAQRKAYIFGGCVDYAQERYSRQNLIFDMTAEDWQLGSDCPIELCDSSVVAIPKSTRLLCIGGRSSQGVCVSYDTVEDRWYMGPPLETGERWGHSACLVQI